MPEEAEVRLELPLPPSANRYWRVYRGRAVLSAAAKAYAREVQAAMALWEGGDRAAD